MEEKGVEEDLKEQKEEEEKDSVDGGMSVEERLKGRRGGKGEGFIRKKRELKEEKRKDSE